MLRFWKSLNNFGRAIILIIACIVIIILAEFRADFVLRDTIQLVTTPITNAISKTSRNVLGIGEIIGSINTMSTENKLLKDNNAELISQNTELLELQVENQHLREQLKMEQERSFSLVSASVVAKEPLGYAKHITINQGKRNKIKSGMPVIAAQGMLVGYISDVYTTSSQVTLLSDPTIEKIPAIIQSNRADGFVIGQELGQGLQMDLIEQDIQVNIGSTVITSGLNSTFPKGLVIGYIQSVKNDSNALFQQADLLPALDYDRLEFVSVITNWPLDN